MLSGVGRVQVTKNERSVLMKQNCTFYRFYVLLTLVVVLAMPAIGISQTRLQKPIGTTSPPQVKLGTPFSPVMSYRIVLYRSMVIYAGLWKPFGVKLVKTFKGPSIERWIAASSPTFGGKTPRFYMSPGTGADNVTYTVSVSASDVVRSDGSEVATQTITTSGSDGSKYTDSMTYIRDPKGNTTETQTVSATDDRGNTTSESTTTTSSGFGAGISGGSDGCYGIMCGIASYYCCQKCKGTTGPGACGDYMMSY